jgi:hypothetical protein
MVGVQRAGQKTLIQETLNNGRDLSGDYRTINNQLLLVKYSHYSRTGSYLSYLLYNTGPSSKPFWKCVLT